MTKLGRACTQLDYVGYFVKSITWLTLGIVVIVIKNKVPHFMCTTARFVLFWSILSQGPLK